MIHFSSLAKVNCQDIYMGKMSTHLDK